MKFNKNSKYLLTLFVLVVYGFLASGSLESDTSKGIVGIVIIIWVLFAIGTCIFDNTKAGKEHNARKEKEAAEKEAAKRANAPLVDAHYIKTIGETGQMVKIRGVIKTGFGQNNFYISDGSGIPISLNIKVMYEDKLKKVRKLAYSGASATFYITISNDGIHFLDYIEE